MFFLQNYNKLAQFPTTQLTNTLDRSVSTPCHTNRSTVNVLTPRVAPHTAEPTQACSKPGHSFRYCLTEQFCPAVSIITLTAAHYHRVSMEQWWDSNWQRTEFLAKNLSQRRFAYHKSHMDWSGIEPVSPRWGRWLTALMCLVWLAQWIANISLESVLSI